MFFFTILYPLNFVESFFVLFSYNKLTFKFKFLQNLNRLCSSLKAKLLCFRVIGTQIQQSLCEVQEIPWKGHKSIAGTPRDKKHSYSGKI